MTAATVARPTQTSGTSTLRRPGPPAARHILTNQRGTIVELTDYGAAIMRIALDDGARGHVDMVPAPRDLDAFVASKRRFGAIVGRYAGRLNGSVVIDGTTYPLATNATGVTLHGGDPGFDKARWDAAPFATRNEVGVVFKRVSPDGEQGFPGALDVRARYALSRRSDVLTLDIVAYANRATVANLTNHVYFNLAGRGTIACHSLHVDADRVVELDKRKLPTGRLPNVAGTSLDYRRARALSDAIDAGGVDEMLVLSGRRRVMLSDPASGRTLVVQTNQPGLQLFTGSSFDGSDRDRTGRPIPRFGAVALEPSHFPNAPAMRGFPSTRVAPGRPLHWRTSWTFGRARSKPPPCTLQSSGSGAGG